jgi:protein TonB
VFDSVLKPKASPQRRLGVGGVVSIALHVLLVAAAIWISASSGKAESEDVKVTFFAPPPPPPPPPGGGAPKKVQKVKPKPQEIVQPKEEVKDEPKPEEPEPTPEPEAQPDQPAGVEGGQVGGVEGGTVGGVVGGVIGGQLGSGIVEFDARMMNKPVKLSGPNPAYTRQAQEHDVEGTMKVRCLVTTDGDVKNCRVIQSLPYMNDAVISALEQRKYQPATTKDGRPLTVNYIFEIKLQLPRR